jgi:hypothetical protein
VSVHDWLIEKGGSVKLILVSFKQNSIRKMGKNEKGKFTKIVEGQHQKLRSTFRKAITGDERIRVRDHVQEQPDYVKLIDKIAFTLGLLNILACQYFLVKLPTFFWLWYSIVIPILIGTRFYLFNRLGYQYFLLDFCYFVLGCTFINLFLCWDWQLCFKICFVYTTGPVCWAIVVWRNSLVFHDYDKITSVYIHLLPCALYYALRWHTDNLRENLVLNDYFIAAMGYLFWQICYFVKTEVFDKSKLDSRPDLITSLRWMSGDKKNVFAKMVLIFCRKVGLLRREEHFDSSSIKTKFIFIIAQFVYSILTFGPTYVFYNSQRCHIAFLLFIFCTATFNGASFYIEVFSKVYQQKIEKLQEMKRIAGKAAPFSSFRILGQQGPPENYYIPTENQSPTNHVDDELAEVAIIPDDSTVLEGAEDVGLSLDSVSSDCEDSDYLGRGVCREELDSPFRDSFRPLEGHDQLKTKPKKMLKGVDESLSARAEPVEAKFDKSQGEILFAKMHQSIHGSLLGCTEEGKTIKSRSNAKEMSPLVLAHCTEINKNVFDGNEDEIRSRAISLCP